MGNRIYGCDDCLAVCPWNKFAQAGREMKLEAREVLRAPRLAELARLDDAGFRALFTKSAVKRIGRNRFLRNVLIAIGNSKTQALPAKPSDCSAMLRRWFAAPRCGRSAVSTAPGSNDARRNIAPPNPIPRSSPNGRRRASDRQC